MKYQHNEPTLHSNKQNVAVVFSIPLYAVTRRRLTILSLFKHYVHTILHPSRTFSFIRSKGTVLIIILCIIFFFTRIFLLGKKMMRSNFHATFQSSNVCTADAYENIYDN